MPATMRFAANAPRLAAAAVMMNPYLRTAAAVAGWLGLAGLFYDEASGLWKAPESGVSPSTGSLWSSTFGSYYASTAEGSCALYAATRVSTNITLYRNVTHALSGNRCYVYYQWFDINTGATPKQDSDWKSASSYITLKQVNCPSGWYVTSAGCVQNPQPRTVTPEEAVEEITKHPMPADVPRHIPTPLPVELPEYQPMFIPTGNPVPNPSYNPSQPVSPSNQPFVQPGVKVEPAPSPSSPWQVDVKPVNRPTESPTGSTDPTTEPSTDTPREDGKEDRDFCDKHPESLACTELDTPEGEIPKSTFEVSYSIENSWGSGSCPADKYATLAGKSIKVYDWAQTCDYVATYVRPILLVLCALGALFIVMPGRAEA